MSFFLTEYEMIQSFVETDGYLPSLTVTDATLVATYTVGTASVVQEKGLEKIFVDSDGGNRTITLPSAATLSKYSPRIINVGSNDVDIVLDGTDTIDGVIGTQTITGQWEAMILKVNKDGTGWIAINRSIP